MKRSAGSGQLHPEEARFLLQDEMVKWLSPIRWDYIGPSSSGMDRQHFRGAMR